MNSAHPMGWIAGWIPLFSFVVSYVLCRLTGRVWVSTVVVMAVAVALLAAVFTFVFWPWLLLYLFLAWFACWVQHTIRSGTLFRRD